MANANVENKKVELLEIKVIVKEFETKEGKKFNAYKAVQNNGKLIDLKFQRVVKNLPEENCIIKVKPENINLDKTRQFPTLWCKKIEEIIKPEYKSADDVIGMFAQPSNPDLSN